VNAGGLAQVAELGLLLPARVALHLVDARTPEAHARRREGQKGLHLPAGEVAHAGLTGIVQPSPLPHPRSGDVAGDGILGTLLETDR
jgi:hypothetical protein